MNLSEQSDISYNKGTVMKHKFKKDKIQIVLGEDKRTNPRILDLNITDGEKAFAGRYYVYKVMRHKDEFSKQLRLELKSQGFKVYET